MKDWWNALQPDKRWLVGSVVAMWAAMLVYLVSPLDIVPDLIPILGWLDDLLMIASTVFFTVHAIKKIRAETGFSGLVPEGMRPRSVHTDQGAAEPVADPFEADLESDGDDLGISGYRPLSREQIKAL